MKRTLLAFLCAILAGLSGAETSVVLESTAQTYRNSDSAAVNPGIGAYAPMSGVVISSESRKILPGAIARAADIEAGGTTSASLADYDLGDALVPPENVDWYRTHAIWSTNDEARAHFLFDEKSDNPTVYAAWGGENSFSWVLTDGTVQYETFRVSDQPSGRPRRIYWTNGQYQGPPVDLSGCYVRFFGDTNILTVVRDDAGNVVRGLYYNEEDFHLYAYCDFDKDKPGSTPLIGTVLMAYYDSGRMEHIIHVQVVQVNDWGTTVVNADVGSELKAHAQGYDTEGLVAEPTSASVQAPDEDNLGPYLYQHTGKHAYSPKNGAVFAIRPTPVGGREQDAYPHTTIWWKEVDEMNVKWPFVKNGYKIGWPKDPVRYVRGSADGERGQRMLIPKSLTCELMDWQEPLDHAKAPEDGEFETVGEGRSLLRILGDDNIWFMPVESVLRDNPRYFTLEPADWDVGTDLIPRGGTLSGLASNVAYDVATELPGYLHRPASDRVVAEQFYADWTDATVLPRAGGAISAILPVNTADYAKGNAKPGWKPGDETTVEVWWMRAYAPEGLVTPIVIPTLPQVYRLAWPRDERSPSAVFASQQGSANDDIWCRNGAMIFDTRSTRMDLDSRRYFANGRGTLMFWTRPQNDASAQVEESMGNLITVSGLAVSADREWIRIRSGGTQASFAAEPSNVWTHVAISCADGVATVYVNGLSNGTMTVDTALISALSTDAVVGGARTVPLREIAEIKFFSDALDAARVADELHEAGEGEADERGLAAYYSFREDEDLMPTSLGYRTATERVLGTVHHATGALLRLPGPPARGKVIFPAGSDPVVYVQNDPDKPGYNPNEEHAFLMAGSGGHVLWAIRDDLNAAYGASPPVALVRYVDGAGNQRMQRVNVRMTSESWPDLAGTCKAGNQFPGPHPFDFLPNPWNERTTWTNLVQSADGGSPVYRDRKRQLWARSEGKVALNMHYELQDGFYLEDREIGEIVPWHTNRWEWTVAWPTNGYLRMPVAKTQTLAADGLPEVWNAASMAIVHPLAAKKSGTDDTVAILYDPTVARLVRELPANWLEEFGMAVGEDVTLSRGRYTFNDAPPSLAGRLYVDASNSKMMLAGVRDAATGLLRPNFATASETNSLWAMSDNGSWRTCVGAIPTAALQPNEVRGGDLVEVDYGPVDHYALTTTGGADEWIVLIENDGPGEMVAEGNPIGMRLIRIEPEYAVPRVVCQEDPQNQLSQKLTMLLTESFAGRAEDYEFEWYSAEPTASGRVPVPGGTDFMKDGAHSGVGAVSFTIGEQGDSLANLVNRYYTCRFRAVNPPASLEGAWSGWAEPALAEGWLQRVLNNITPYTQRMDDLEQNGVDTAVSMLRMAGPPYEGDVALNQENLAEVGLIQLYQTLLNKGESLSLAQGIDIAEANDQLMLAVERLTELYTILGDEAYADALNPTIGFGSNFSEVKSGLEIDYGAANTSLFCFDNQVRSLLDEELCLLRGRSGTDAPSTQTSPYYNRLVWNFTRGLSAGEVAYAVNYDISGLQATSIGYEQAKALYPQGHGDAYGHYLSALMPWYRLLRNPNFSWPRPAKSEMNVGLDAVNVSYSYEAKFAEAAANVAKTAARVVDLTARAAWRDEGGAGTGAGYYDSNPTKNAFGYGEWANRGAYGALVNWAVANSLLPVDRTAGVTDSSAVDYTDYGLERIDRGTVGELVEICSRAAEIQSRLDRADAGCNPIGLSENAIPFDITPIGAADGTRTHYEQVAARAETAVANARQVLDRAQASANRLRLVAEAENGITVQTESVEAGYNDDLIAIFGRPYADDIGPTGTYRQGYDGPDLVNYLWMDLSPYGLRADDTVAVSNFDFAVVENADMGERTDFTSCLNEGRTLTYSLSASGLVVKPENITGRRLANGSIQIAYSDFLTAYAKFRDVAAHYSATRDQAVTTLGLCTEGLAEVRDRADGKDEMLEKMEEILDQTKDIANSECAVDELSTAFDLADGIANLLVTSEGGLLLSGVAAKIAAIAGIATETAASVGIGIARGVLRTQQKTLAEYEHELAVLEAERENEDEYASICETAVGAVSSLNSALVELDSAYLDAVSALDRVSAEVEKGNRLIEGRTLDRRIAASNVSRLRYNDMFFRILRNEALSRYESSFGIAQTYAFLAAKAYGYDTGLLDAENGGDFLAGISAARSLGELEDALAKMRDNWAGLKGRLGINNPQPDATWFSLRSELKRILPGAEGDRAWRTALADCYVADLSSVPEYARLCQPVASSTAPLALAEPGFAIPFATTIDFAKNFFGNDIAAGDHAFDSTYFATKIAAAGIWLEGYSTQLLGANPVCYLVPAGEDRMRVPGTSGGEVGGWNVLDQVVPQPYAIGSAELDSEGWRPTYDGSAGGADPTVRIRRYPSFRAGYGARGVEPADSALVSPRLVGRSVWNTRWVLIIPAGSMLTDREKACERFLSTVTDIRLGLRTYSNSGN